jgi:hypothetical protein
MPRRASLVLIVVLMLAAGTAAVRPAHAQPATDLPSLALTTADLGGNWRLRNEVRDEDDVVYFATFVRSASSTAPSGSLILGLLHDSRRLVKPVDLLSVTLTAMSRVRELGPGATLSFEYVPPALVGEEPAQARYVLGLGPFSTRGDLLIWRRGPYLVVMDYGTSRDLNVVPFAMQQDAKLVAALDARARADQAAIAATAPASVAGGVAIVAVSGAKPGGMASVTVQAPAGALCTIEHRSATRNLVRADGLETRTVEAGGVTTWSWTVPMDSPAGTATVRVTCDGVSVGAPLPIG